MSTRTNTRTGSKADVLWWKLCPPKGEINEPLCNLKQRFVRSLEYVLGPLKFLEDWDEIVLSPVVEFSEFWESTGVSLGTEHWNEEWEFMNFTPSILFLEEWEEIQLTPSNEFTESWEESEYEPGTEQFLEEWEAIPAGAHEGNWFLSEDFSILDPAPIITWGFNGLFSGFFTAQQGLTASGPTEEAILRSMDGGFLPWELTHTFSGNDRTDVTASVGFIDVADTGDNHVSFFVQRSTGLPAEIWTSFNGGGPGGLTLDATISDTQRVTQAVGFFSHAWFGTIPLAGMDPAVYSYNNADGIVQEVFFSGATEINTIVSYLEPGESIALYVGVSHPSGARVYRGQVGGVDGSWDLLHTFAETNISDIRAFPNFNGDSGSLMYAALYSEGTSVPRRIYKSDDGVSWSLSYTIPDASPALDQITTRFISASQFEAPTDENLLLAVGTNNVAALDAKVYTVDITIGAGNTWVLSEDFNDTFSDPLPTVTALELNSQNGNLYAATGDFLGTGIGFDGVSHYSCPDEDMEDGGGDPPES
jgi:hypothetical protein